MSIKLAFICGSIEQGRDGVGDYSRVLGRFLSANGYDIHIIALFDHFTDSVIDGKEEGTGFWLFRLPLKGYTFEQRMHLVMDKLSQIHCDIVSLQYVPFSFHPKGLAYNMIMLVRSIGKSYFLHIMFHELWVGMAKEDSFKMKIWGWGQRQIIKWTIHISSPDFISTQLSLYKEQLRRLTNISIYKIPLVCNIDIAVRDVTKDALYKNELGMIVFGNIYPDSPAKAFLKEFKENRLSDGTKLKLYFIGSNGIHLQDWINACKENAISFEERGILSESEINGVAAKCSYAIVTTPYYLIEKSGSAVAMLHAGLKVICVAKKWTPFLLDYIPEVSNLPIFEYRIGNLKILDDFFSTKKTSFTNDEALAKFKKILQEQYHKKH